MKKTTKRFAFSTVVAAAGGYLTGILTAPKSGRETRNDIKETASKKLSEAEKQLKKLHTEMNDVIEKGKANVDKLSGVAKKELDTALETTRQAKEKVREILSSVHEGGAEDKELKKAIQDAQKAVDHLKSYLKK